MGGGGRGGGGGGGGERGGGGGGGAGGGGGGGVMYAWPQFSKQHIICICRLHCVLTRLGCKWSMPYY